MIRAQLAGRCACALSLLPLLTPIATAQEANQSEAEGVAEAASETSPQIGRARITLQNDRVYTGELKLNENGDLTISSKSTGDDAALDFAAIRVIASLNEVGRSLEPIVDASVPRGADGMLFRLYRRQRLVGTVQDIDDSSIVFESEGFGTVAIKRESAGELVPLSQAVRGDESSDAQISRWSDWEGAVDDAKRSVSVTADHVRLGETGSSIVLERSLPGTLNGTRAEIGIDWMGVPEFKLAIGAKERHVSLEVWDRHLTLVRWNSDGTVDVAQHAEELDLDSSAIFHLKFDERATLSAIESSDGARTEVDLSVALDGDEQSVRIEALGRPMKVFVADVSGGADAAAGADGVLAPRLLRGGEIKSFDAGTGHLILEDGAMVLRDVPTVQFVTREKRGVLDLEPSAGRVTLRNGEMLEIGTVTLEDGTLVITADEFETPVRIELSEVARLTLRESSSIQIKSTFQMTFAGKAPSLAGFQGLTTTGDGAFVLARSEPGFKSTVEGTVEGPFEMRRTSNAMFLASRRRFPQQVVLKSGETFPAKVEFDDAAGVTIKTPFTDDSVVIRPDDLRAVLFASRQVEFQLAELVGESDDDVDDNMIIWNHNAEVTQIDPTVLTQKKLDRALLVPRAQSKNPGAHLLVAKNGDLMRTTVIGQDGSNLQVKDSSGAELSIPTKVLAMCVYLVPNDDAADSNEVSPGEAPEEVAGAAEETPESAADEREDDASTSPAPGTDTKPRPRWTVDLGNRALLRADVTSADQSTIELTHSIFGSISLSTDDFVSLSFDKPGEGRYEVLEGWHTTPMPEPVIPD